MIAFSLDWEQIVVGPAQIHGGIMDLVLTDVSDLGRISD